MSREQSPSRHSQVKVTAVINSDRSEVSVENDGHTSAHISLQDEDNTITSRSDKDNGKKTEGIRESSDSKTPTPEILLKDNPPPEPTKISFHQED